MRSLTWCRQDDKSRQLGCDCVCGSAMFLESSRPLSQPSTWLKKKSHEQSSHQHHRVFGVFPTSDGVLQQHRLMRVLRIIGAAVLGHT